MREPPVEDPRCVSVPVTWPQKTNKVRKMCKEKLQRNEKREANKKIEINVREDAKKQRNVVFLRAGGGKGGKRG